MATLDENVEPQVAEVYLACSKCGASLPDGAQFCLKCGKPVSVRTKAAVGLDASDAPLEEVLTARAPRRKSGIFLLVLLALLIAGAAWAATSENPFAQDIQELVGWKHDHVILDNPFSVTGHNFRYYKFALPEGSMNVTMIGGFTVTGENQNTGRKDKDKNDKNNKNKEKDNDAIEVFVLSEPAFTVWQNGYATSSVYESGRVAQGVIQAELPNGAGIYYLVFSNKFSPKTSKNVTATALLRYKSWLPDWFRRMKGRTLNWLGL